MRLMVRFGLERFLLPTVWFGRFGLNISDGSDGSICKLDVEIRDFEVKISDFRIKIRDFDVKIPDFDVKI